MPGQIGRQTGCGPAPDLQRPALGNTLGLDVVQDEDGALGVGRVYKNGFVVQHDGGAGGAATAHQLADVATPEGPAGDGPAVPEGQHPGAYRVPPPGRDHG